MSSIKHLDMAAAVSVYTNITVKKSLFSTKVIYTPTGSNVKAMVLEYSPSEGEKVLHLLDLPLEKMAADISQNGKPATGANGHFRMEVCLSEDHQFCVLQLSRYTDFNYHPLFDPRFYEGKDVEYLTKLL